MEARMIELHKPQQTGGLKYPTLTQLKMNRKFRQWEIEADIRKLEKKFRNTSKIINPEGWFALQDELGAAYRKLMACHPDFGKVLQSRITNNYFMGKA